MSEKKNIDKLFKEQFKDFEETPRDIVWERIEHELHKDKRKRRIIPLWWKVAGVAAVLALLFTVGNMFNGSFNNDPTKQEVVDTENLKEDSNNNVQTDESNELANPSNTSVSQDTNNKSIVNQENSSNTKDSQTQDFLNSTNTSNDSKNAIVSTNSNTSEKQNTVVYETNSKSQNKDAIANTNKSMIKQNVKEKAKIKTTSSSKTAIANTSNDVKSKAEANTTILKKEQSEIDKLIKETKQSKKTKVASTTNSEKENAISSIDTSSVNEAIKEENAIEKAIADAEKEKEETKEEDEEFSKRWSVAPNIAPVYFNTLGKGSSLDNQFVENSKEGNVSVSYGVKGTYAVSKKLKIRAGVNKVDLGYSTKNVLVFENVNPNPGARQMQNVNVSTMQTSSTYISASNLSFGNGPEILNAKERGSIEQQLGFIEVPLELEYNLVDHKIGLNLIGGFSTLFLNNNEIYSVENNGNRTIVGEATNIKDMSYSANFGIGVNYNISEQLRFNLEPTFKYQINTFNNTSGDFQPFFIGVYTGLSFKF